MRLIGKPTIHPFFFFTGKISGYVVWIIFFLSAFNQFPDLGQSNETLRFLSYFFTIIALLIIVISLINLGRSTRLGLPEENTEFVTGGLYRYSRNPMYLGFDLLTLSAIIFTSNLFVALAGIYSIAVYHFIIRSEEVFLEQRFGSKFIEYKKNARRYI